MWKNVGNGPEYEFVEVGSGRSETLQRRWDWSGSDIGLFAGLLALVTFTITMLLYFSMVNQKQFQHIGVLMINITDTGITAFMCIAIIIGFLRVRNLQFLQKKNETDGLLVISASGLFIYSSFTIFAGCLSTDAFMPTGLLIASGILELIQVNLQLLFITDLKQKRITEEHGMRRPGRQIVTFLIFSNLGLWITYNFEILKVNAPPI